MCLTCRSLLNKYHQFINNDKYFDEIKLQEENIFLKNCLKCSSHSLNTFNKILIPLQKDNTTLRQNMAQMIFVKDFFIWIPTKTLCQTLCKKWPRENFFKVYDLCMPYMIMNK